MTGSCDQDLPKPKSGGGPHVTDPAGPHTERFRDPGRFRNMLEAGESPRGWSRGTRMPGNNPTVQNPAKTGSPTMNFMD